jgi:hypothetical protein
VAPIAFNSVSAYRFWLTFIIVVAMSRNGGDCDSKIVVRGSGGSNFDRCNATGIPRTGMPRSMSASVSE